MREIKFRAWSKENKEMFSHELLRNAGDGVSKLAKMIGQDVPGGLLLPLDDKDLIFMQFTGLKDKNGREIYEGDIVKIESHTVGLMDGLRKSEKPKVKYRRIGWHPNGSWNSYRTLSNEHVGIVSVYKPEKWCEVVGNIYEHPHLLEGDIHE